MKRLSSLIAASLLLLAVECSTAGAANYFWDRTDGVPGANPGSPNFGDGIWSTSATNWNTNSDGSGSNIAWTDGNAAIFSAGTDLQGSGPPYDAAVTLSGNISPSSIEFQEGKISLVKPTSTDFITIGGNPIRIDNGAYLQIPNLNVIAGATTAHILTIDGGSLENTITGVGSGIWTSPTGTGSRIELTSAGGTFVTNNATPTTYSIMAYGSSTATSVVGMSGATTAATLHKTGLGEFRALNNWTFTDLDVQQGLYRINGTGGGETGFGAATGTMHIADDASVGTSISITSPATRSIILNGPSSSTLGSHFVLSAGWTINGPISGTGSLSLGGTIRPDTNALLGSQTQVLVLQGTNTYQGKTLIEYGTLEAKNGNAIPDTSQVVVTTTATYGVTTVTTKQFRVSSNETVGSITGGSATLGSVNINGAAVTLTTGADGLTTTYDGSMIGTGSLAKTGGGTFTMTGPKSYTGNTTVSGGTLSTNAASLADAANVSLTTGAFFNLNFAGTDAINSLFIDSALQAAGTWGAIGSGAAHTSALITGTGLLNAAVGAVAGLPGDFNNDGKVDASDYVTWRKNEIANAPLANDGGAANQAARYTLWRSSFGTPGAGSGSGLSGGAVPEPATLVFAGLAMFFGLVIRRR
jgi:fibronectin-binding autotransporter adhesin